MRGNERRRLAQAHRRIGRERGLDPLRGERHLPDADAGRVEDGVGDGGGARDRGGFADPERRIVGALDAAPPGYPARPGRSRSGSCWKSRLVTPAGVEPHLLHQGAADRLDDVAVHLQLDPFRVDHQAGVLRHHHPGDPDLAAAEIDLHVGDPGREGGAVSRKFAVGVARIGDAAPLGDRRRRRAPACAARAAASPPSWRRPSAPPRRADR